MTVAITATQRKSLRYLTLDQKIRKEFKKVNKEITFTCGKNLQSILHQNKSKYYLIVILECTNCIVNAMVDILGNQRKKY